jgi:hypothetical protein
MRPVLAVNTVAFYLSKSWSKERRNFLPLKLPHALPFLALAHGEQMGPALFVRNSNFTD